MDTYKRKYSYESQKVELNGVINARDLGGYVLPDGRKIKRGLLLRGGNLNRATDETLDRLGRDFRLSYVFDFRTKGEVDHAPDRSIAGCSHMWLPTIDERTETLSEGVLPVEAYRNLEQYLLDHCNDKSVQETGKMMYPALIRNEYTQLQYAVFLQKIIDTDKGAIYWHCSQGKDRTGVGAALLLAALGADRELILEDFAISNDYYSSLIADLKRQIRAKGGGDEECRVIQAFIGVDVDYFNDTLDIIDKEYGGMQNYLLDIICLSPEDLKTLQDRYLE